MKLSISRETLFKNLKYAQSVVEKRTSIAILSNVKLVAADNQLTMTATDNDIAIQGKCEAFVDDNGATTVNAQKFFEIVSKIPEGVMVNMELTDNGNRLAVTAGKAKFSLACLNAEAFPDMSTVSGGAQFNISGSDLKRLLNKSVFAASTDDTRAYLNGIYLHTAKDGDNDVLRAVATDGHRLARVDMSVPAGASDIPSVILPRKTVAELRKLAESENEVQLTVTDKKIQAEAGDIVFTSKVVDGTFPDYERVIPQDNNANMDVPRRTLLAAVERVAILSHEKSRSVRFALSNDNLLITANNPDQENAAEELKVSYGSDGLEIGFNARYVADIGQQTEGDDLQFCFKDGASPVIVTDAQDPQALFVVMPMRI